jgi:hypothetical protein
MTRIRTLDAGPCHRAVGRAASRADRRGVLLLIVLSMLTLFLMLGAAYLAAATRARTAAKAYAKLTFGADDARIPFALLLDDVLLRVVRGPVPGALTGTTQPPDAANFESLLEDRYGVATTTLTGSANVSDATAPPLFTGTLTLAAANVHPTDLAGRVLTFVEPGRVATSHRIVRARTGANTNAPQTSFLITLDNPFRSDRAVPPTEQQAKVVINGREFSGDPASSADKNEPWDGFDHAKNPFLARVAADPASIAKSVVTKASYVDSAPSGDVCDNDGDGVPDGQFFSWDLPSFIDAAGNMVRVDASVLVVDLDGRFNLNAHGSLAPTLYPATHTGWTEAAGISGVTLDNAPLGSGYGPAEIQFNMATGTMGSGTSGNPKLFDAGSRQPGENPRLSIVVGDDGSRQTGRRPPDSRYGENAPTPRLGRVDGKYGEKTASDTALMPTNLQMSGSATANVVPRPGEPDVDDAASRIGDRRALPNEAATTNRGIPPIWWPADPNFNWHAVPDQPDPRGVFNSPPDLHGRMKTLTLAASGTSIVPRLVFAKPEWDDAAGVFALESKDDPYEILLDTRRGVGGWTRDPGSANTLRHNPFTLAELEPMLRPYDGDASRHPQRLATMLGTDAEASRLKFTTESWDTTTITGSAALRIYGKPGANNGWLQLLPPAVVIHGTSAVTGVLSGDLARGEKFDLNRAFDPSAPANAGYQPAQPYFVQRQAFFKDFYTLLVSLQSGTGTLQSGTNAGSAQSLAQWAANVVKFRDADSRIIPFEYEQDVRQNGWTVNSDVGNPTGDTSPTTRRVVWPAVRPEIVIREAVAWHNNDTAVTGAGKSGMMISLHRPWNAKAYASGTANLIDAEPCDYALDTLVDNLGNPQATGRPSNQVDLGKKADASVLGPSVVEFNTTVRTHYPIWRLRISDGTTTRYIRFDTTEADTNPDEIALSSVMDNDGTTKPRIGPDSTVTIYSGTMITVGMGAMGTTDVPVDVATHGGHAELAPGLQTVPSLMTSGTIYLERLSDPSVTLTEPGNAPGKVVGSADPPTGEMIWKSIDAEIGPRDQTEVPVRYVVVDEMRFDVTETDTQSMAPVQLMTSRRSTTGGAAFWKTFTTTPILATPPGNPGQVPGPPDTGDTAWFVWPNRPFISAAELLLVPQGDCLTILENYEKPDPEDWDTIGIPLDDAAAMTAVKGLLFDCVHVPTRFSSIHTTATTSQPDHTGIHPTTTPVNQFSAHREPGRVNLNTITSDQVWNTVVAGPLANPLVSGTAAGLGMAHSANKTVKTMLEAMDLESGGTDVVVDNDAALAVALNPAHALYTATRLANTVTTRSNVFAIWITLREYVGNSPNDDPDSVRYHRGFYIVDRSIPVGFEEGRDHNVWECVRLRRVIE